MRKGLHFAALVIFLLGYVCSGSSQGATPLVYTSPGSVYVQNFDSLPQSGSFSPSGKGPFNLSAAPVNAANLVGWQYWMPAGSNTHANFSVGTGSSTGNAIYSLGSAGSTDRALGSLTSSSGIYSIGLVLTNNTGLTLNRITITFTAEQWRKGGSGNRNTWSFRYKTGIITGIDQAGTRSQPLLDMFSPVNTTSATSLNGNLPENQHNVSYSINNIYWKNGEQLLLRWDDTDEPGSDDACALDNFSFSAEQISAPPIATTSSATGIGPSSAILNGTVDDQFSNTTVVFAYDSSAAFTNARTVAASPASIPAGTGATQVVASVAALVTGTKYYFRIQASNARGITQGSTLHFSTTYSVPVVITTPPSLFTMSSVKTGGQIVSDGGTAIIEKGIVWSFSPLPTLGSNKIKIDTTASGFSQVITALPAGTLIYVRAYATNLAGTAYGASETITTPTSITSLTNAGPRVTNAATVQYLLKTEQGITGLTPSHFSLLTKGLSGATITSVSGQGINFTITINTGSGNGTLAVKMLHDSGLSLPVSNLGLISSLYRIDKSPPVIYDLSIPDKTMKIGDTVPVTVYMNADTDTYKLTTGKINNLPLTQWNKINDSLYSARFVITNGAADVAADKNILVSLIVTDSAGNSNIAYQQPISQNADAIDANKPFISSLVLPPEKLYKAGDTLTFIFLFNEKISITHTGITAGFSITIGSRTKFVAHYAGNGSDSLLFRYLIPAGESDKDGIRLNSPLGILNGEIKDLAGNMATLSFSVPSTKNILVDGVAPVVSSVTVPPSAVYRTGNLLDFIINYSKKVLVHEGVPMPTLNIIMGTMIRQASYTSGSGSNALLFRYRVEAEDMDKDGIKILSPFVTGNSTILDEAGNQASLQLNNIGALSNVLVNPPTAMATGVSAPSDSLYKTADSLLFSVNFNEPVFVNTAGGIPSLKFTCGNSVKQAFYSGGTGTISLSFVYAVQNADLDSNGIQLNATLALNNGTLKDERGNNVPLTLHNLPDTRNILIDAVLPIVKAVSTPVKNTYRESDVLEYMVHFTEPVLLTKFNDAPYIKLQIGNITRNLAYHSGSGSSAWLFRYKVQKGDLDKNGIRLDTMLITTGNIIRDKAGNEAMLTLKNIGAQSGIKIDAVAPSFLTNIARLLLCENAININLSDELAVSDAEDEETLSWQLSRPPMYGTISNAVTSASANGHVIRPGTILYTPGGGYSGLDSLLFTVTDGSYSDSKTLYLHIQPALKNNHITSTNAVCINSIPLPVTGSIPSGGDGSYRMTWEVSVAGDSSGFSKATGTNSSTQYAPGRLTTTTWFRRKVESGMCIDISAATKISVLTNGYWTGNFDSDWNNPNNWCNNHVPDTATDVYIHANQPFNPKIKDSASCYNMYLATGAALTINGTLRIKGNIRNTGGMMDASHGSLLFMGNAAQSIPPRTLRNGALQNLFVNNPAGLSLTEKTFVAGTVKLHTGILTTNNYLHLTRTGSIGGSAIATAVIGKITMDHLIPVNRNGFYQLGHPFTHSVGLDMISDSVSISGSGGPLNGFTKTATDQPSAFRFEPQLANDSSGIESGWLPFTHTDGQFENAWKPFSGIRLLLKVNDTLQGKKDATLHFFGHPNTGQQEITWPKNARPFYAVMGNPYPSPVDLSLITRGTGIGMHYWIWQPAQGLAGGYTSMPFTQPYVLPAFGSIILRVNGDTSNTLTFTENCKTTDTPVSLPVTVADDRYMVELQLESDSIFWDRLLIFAVDSARVFFDKLDAEKFRNDSVNFYSISRDQKMLSIDARPLNNTSNLPLGLQTKLQRSFRIRVVKATLPTTNTLQLHDRYLNKWTPLATDSIYSFETTADTASSGNQRFVISTPQKIITTLPSGPKIHMQLMPVPARDKMLVTFATSDKGNTSISILTQNGTLVKQFHLGIKKEGQALLPLDMLVPGIYLVEIRSDDRVSAQKFIKQ